MRRTIAEARRDFESLVEPRLNDAAARRYRELLATAEQRAHQHAADYLAGREQEALTLRDEALRELTEVRDALDELSRTSSDGRMTSRDLTHQLARLRQRQEEAEGQLDRADQVVEHITQVEENPIAWFDALTERMPSLQGDFPW